MKVKLKCLLLFCLTLTIGKAQYTNLVWSKSFSGPSNAFAKAITTDGSGNVYTSGYFQGTRDFDPGAGSSSLTAVGNWDVFITKLDASGNFVWARQFGGSQVDYCWSVAVDASGNVYTTGAFHGTVDFDPGAGTSTLTATGNPDAFISKLDGNGDFVWVKQLEGAANSSSEARAIAIDVNGDVYTAGSFAGTFDFDPGAGVSNISSGSGNWSIFISKLSSSGNFVWAKDFKSNNHASAWSITTDASGNVYSTGYFNGTTDFDPDNVTTSTLTPFGSDDIFVSKLNSSGNFVWAKKMGGTGASELGESITVDGSGNVYTTGVFTGTSDFDPGAGTSTLTTGFFSSYISKLDVNGDFVWVRQPGGIEGTTITKDGSGNVIVGTSASILKLDAAGTTVWSESQMSRSLKIDGSGTIYSTGETSNSDFYVLKLAQVPTTQLSTGYCGITETSLDQYLYWNVISGATNYRCEISDGVNTPIIYYRGNSSSNMRLHSVSGIRYGTSYSVRVAAYVGGAWLPYGPVCGVTTPTPPTTQLSEEYCDILENSLEDLIYWDRVLGASNYRLEISDGVNPAIVYYRGSSLDNVSLDLVPGINYATTYAIKVAAYVGGVWLSYGPPCDVTTPPSFRPGNNETTGGSVVTGLETKGNFKDGASLKIYPNPTSGEFTIGFENHYKEITVTILNVIGKEIQSETFGQNTMVSLGIEGEPGIYFVKVKADGVEQPPVKVIKQ